MPILAIASNSTDALGALLKYGPPGLVLALAISTGWTLFRLRQAAQRPEMSKLIRLFMWLNFALAVVAMIIFVVNGVWQEARRVEQEQDEAAMADSRACQEAIDDIQYEQRHMSDDRLNDVVANYLPRCRGHIDRMHIWLRQRMEPK